MPQAVYGATPYQYKVEIVPPHPTPGVGADSSLFIDEGNDGKESFESIP